jgi:hypothetical protein
MAPHHHSLHSIRSTLHRSAHVAETGWTRATAPFRAARYGVASGWDRLTLHFLDRWDSLSARVAGAADATRWRWYRLADGVVESWDRFAERTTAPGRRGIAIGAAALTALLCLLLIASVISIGHPRSEPVHRATVATSSDMRTGAAPTRSNIQGTASSEDPLPGVNVHVNEDAGYLFSYPDDWDLSSSGTTTTVLSPNGEVTMSFEVAPPGPLRHVSDEIVQDLTASHDDVRLVSDEVGQTPQGEESLVIGGEATDSTGKPITFLVITIHGDDHNRAILVRFGAGSAPLRALPGIQEIIASFRTSQPR